MEVEQNYNFLIDYLYKYDYDANVFETSNPHELIRNLWITTKELNIGIPRPDKGLKSVQFLSYISNIWNFRTDFHPSVLKLKEASHQFIAHKEKKNRLGEQAVSLFKSIVQQDDVTQDQAMTSDLLDEFFGNCPIVQNLDFSNHIRKRRFGTEETLACNGTKKNKTQKASLPTTFEQMQKSLDFEELIRTTKEKIIMFINQRCHSSNPTPFENVSCEQILQLFGQRLEQALDGSDEGIRLNKAYINKQLQYVFAALVHDLLQSGSPDGFPTNYSDAFCFLLSIESRFE